MPNEERAALLQFATGSPRPPALGFAQLSGYAGKIHPFALQCVPGADQGRLPSATTCFNTLRLPEYASKEVLAEKLRASLAASRDFDEEAVADE